MTCCLALLVVVGWATTTFGNEPPAAEFFAYRSADGGSTEVLFDASASHDPDGEIVRFQWVFGDGTTGSGMRIEHTYPDAGRYNVTLVVGDEIGAWHMITRTLDIADLPAAQAASPTAESFPSPPIGNRIGQRAPDFALPDLSGNNVRLSDFRERAILLEFWLSTCPGCRAAMPDIEALFDAYADRGLVVLLVSLDEEPEVAASYLFENGYEDFIVVFESLPLDVGTGAAFGVTSTPHVFLIDRGGIVRFSGHPDRMPDDAVSELL
jgi:thiol-disulfide isomerase/thioredoxin